MTRPSLRYELAEVKLASAASFAAAAPESIDFAARFDTQPSGPPSVVFVDRMPFPPNTRREDFQLPVSESDTILLGSVSKVQPYLSEDGTNLYTEYTVSVEEVFKDSASLFPKKDSVIALF